MLSSIVFTLSTMLVAYASGGKYSALEIKDAGSAIEARSGLSDTNDGQSSIEARSGWHIASVYTDWNCGGGTVLYQSGFGCGGQCFQFGRGTSILLQQENTGNPKPTANLYTSNNCQGSPQSAGIYSGEHSGCTNGPSYGAWGSAYLYFNC